MKHQENNVPLCECEELHADIIEKKFYSAYSGIALPIKVLAPTIFIVSMLGVFRGFYQGQGTMIPTAVSQLIEQIINAVVSIAAGAILVKAYKDYLKENLSKKRYIHSLNVAKVAEELAKEFDGDEDKCYIAGLLHDAVEDTWMTCEEVQKEFSASARLMRVSSVGAEGALTVISEATPSEVVSVTK